MTYQTHTHSYTYLKQMPLKEAYLSSTFFSSRYLARLQGFRRVESPDVSTTPRGLGGFMSVVWMWLRLCVYVVTGHGEPLEVDTQRAMGVRRLNRARRHLNHHFTKPSVRGAGKPARNLAPFCAFGPRRVSPTQFMERLCRLSLWGRVSIYKFLYYAHRQVREALWAMFACGDFREPRGLCDAHLWPS